MAAPASHFVSVLMCSGPMSGKVFACPTTELVHRRKKLDIGAHVLVKQRDGRRRCKGVVVHMNPRINAALGPSQAAVTRQVILAKRAIPDAATRLKSGSSLGPVTLPAAVSQPTAQPALVRYSHLGAVSQPTAQPALVRYNHLGTAKVTCLFQPAVFRHAGIARPRPLVSTRFPGRHRVRRELNFKGPQEDGGLRSINAPLTTEELDGCVPLDILT